MARFAGLTVVLAGVAALLLAPGAHATQARVDYVEIDERIDVYTDYVVRVVARPGERNDVEVATDRRGRVLITERGAARLTVGRDCRKLSRRRARCAPRRPLDRIRVVLGGGDDRARVAPGPWRGPVQVLGGDGRDRVRTAAAGTVAGGPGRDVVLAGREAQELDGGAGDDRLEGGAGDDRLLGRGGRDVMRGGSGDDELLGADGVRAVGRDRVDGGPGTDVVSYSIRARPVRVRLAAPVRAGRGGTEDVLRAVEGAIGGDADDRLTGDEGPNRLDGGDGADVLTGLGGDDELQDREGGGRLDAGPGDDRVVAWFGHGAVACGPGADEVVATEDHLLGGDCELADARQHPAGLQPAHPVQRHADAYVFEVRCGPSGPCRDLVLRLARPGARAPWRDRAATPGEVLADVPVGTLDAHTARRVEVPRTGALAAAGPVPVVVRAGPAWAMRFATGGWGILLSG